MLNTKFLKAAEAMFVELEEELGKISNADHDMLSKSEERLMVIDERIRRLKTYVLGHSFSDMAEEVYFFKYVKPKFIAVFLYHLGILGFESNKPFGDNKYIVQYYRGELLKIKKYQDEHVDFNNYMLRGASYLDQKYFVRNSYDIKMWLPSQLYSYDEHFTTSHDYQVAVLISQDQLTAYLHEQVLVLEQQKSVEAVQDSIRVEWTASKAALVELIYALHQEKVLNNGSLELSETIHFFERHFGVKLENFHKILYDIKQRKINRLKFIDLLRDDLERHFSREDE